MLLARLGTAKAKPNGIFVVPSDECSVATFDIKCASSDVLTPTLKFMATVPLKALPGVGRKLLKKLLMKTTEQPKKSFEVFDSEAASDGDIDEDDEDDGKVEMNITNSPRATHADIVVEKCCADLWNISLSTLTSWVGGPTLAKSLFEACRGRDHRKLQSMQSIGDNRKSVGAEVNYGHRYKTDEQGTAMQKAERFLLNLCGEVVNRLAQVMCQF